MFEKHTFKKINVYGNKVKAKMILSIFKKIYTLMVLMIIHKKVVSPTKAIKFYREPGLYFKFD